MHLPSDAGGLVASSTPSLSWYIGIEREKSSAGPPSQLRQWSSFIGIVTAIVGNILISFALNTQRYAHLRIDREHCADKDSSPSGKKRPNGITRNYGAAQQEATAEESARINVDAPGPGQGGKKLAFGNINAVDGETHPLSGSFDSDRTLRGSEKAESDADARKSYLRSPYWWIGIALMTIGETGNFLAYGFAPASIVSPLGVVAIISNCIIAPCMLKERFRQRDFWGVLVAIGGVVTVILSAKQNERKLGPAELWDAIKRWEFLLYVCITIALIIALMIASPKYGNKTILIDLGLVGLFGGYTALSTKGVASLLSVSLFNAFAFPMFYFLVAVLALSAIMQIRYLNRALQSFYSTQVIPTQFVLFTLSVIIGSSVLYRDFESATAERVGKFICGCLLTFFGVYLITSKRQSQEDGIDDDDMIEQEEGIRLLDEEAGDVDVDHHASPLQQVQSNLQSASHPSAPEPLTPFQLPSVVSSFAGSESAPSAPATSSTSGDLPYQHPWSSTTDPHINETPTPSPSTKPNEDIYKTPQQTSHPLRDEIEATPFFTPSTNLPRGSATPRGDIRNSSSTLDLETPTKKPKSRSRPPSPPKPGPETADLSRSGTATGSNTPINAHSLVQSARDSFGRLMTPGPLMNPLSSSLSAMVAETLLKGDVGSGRSLRRGRSLRSQRHSTTAVGPVATPGTSTENLGEEDIETSVGKIGRRKSVQADQALGQPLLPGPVSRKGGKEDNIRRRERAKSDSLGNLFSRLHVPSRLSGLTKKAGQRVDNNGRLDGETPQDPPREDHGRNGVEGASRDGGS